MRILLLSLVLALSLGLLLACGDEAPKTPGDAGSGDAGSGDAGAEQPGVGGQPTDASLVGLSEALAKEVAAAMAKGRDFLLTQQEKGGGFTDHGLDKMQANVSFTAMAVSALVGSTPATSVSKDKAIRAGLAFLEAFQREDGAIVDNPQWTTYCTSAAVSALANAKIGEFRHVQSKAMAYLVGSQIVDAKAKGSVGGFPYKDDQTADGSNAFIAVSALEAGGLPKDSPVRKRMEIFASGLQNNDESNPGTLTITTGEGEERTVVSSNDGGAIYRVGESKAGMIKRSDGTWELRSYGSMTYAVLKLLMFAGVKADDARVAALVGWLSSHWTVERNPGFEMAEDPQSAGQQGYYYYLYTMARALDSYEAVSGKPLVVRDSDGRKHGWRSEIARAVLQRQAPGGSWRNSVPRWMEDSQTLVTSFALQTLSVLNGRLD